MCVAAIYGIIVIGYVIQNKKTPGDKMSVHDLFLSHFKPKTKRLIFNAGNADYMFTEPCDLTIYIYIYIYIYIMYIDLNCFVNRNMLLLR